MQARILIALLVALIATGCASSPAIDATGTADATDAAISESTAVATPSSTDAVGADEGSSAPPPTTGPTPEALGDIEAGEARSFGVAPETPDGPLSEDTAAAVDTLLGERLLARQFDDDTFAAIRSIGAGGDIRTAWWLTDLLRVVRNPDLAATISGALSELMGVGFDPFDTWGDAVDHLIAWDTPAPPGYLDYKRNIYVVVESRWEPLFVDDADIDWRMVSWGGVLIDDRPFGETDTPCNCIPAVDNPRTTDVAGGDEWLDESTIVFGVVIDGDARAYPRSIMEVREMVNDTLGGRSFAMPYCTLCGSAQVWFTDNLHSDLGRPVLRTSGLLTRSNKVMYDVETRSIFDTFRGRAVSGPLFAAGVELDQHSVITTTWGQWKAAHPDTTVLAIEEALGRPDSDLRNTRDGNGPIFPIGDVDPRLPVQEDVLGLFSPDGSPVAFHVAAARNALERGETVEAFGLTVVLDGGGLRAVDDAGVDVASHQAFWFAWSQFHPTTALWPTM